MSMGLNFSVRKYGWRLGLQAITIFLISVFFIGNKLIMSNHFNDCNHCFLTNLCIIFTLRNVLQVSIPVSSSKKSNTSSKEPNEEDKVQERRQESQQVKVIKQILQTEIIFLEKTMSL